MIVEEMKGNARDVPCRDVFDRVYTETFGECNTCFTVISGEVWMCPQCSSIQCSSCLDQCFKQREQCPKCRGKIDKADFVRCRPIEQLINRAQQDKSTNCYEHETKKTYFCTQCSEPFCPMCLLENGLHKNHPRINMKDLTRTAVNSLQLIDEGLTEKRHQTQ